MASRENAREAADKAERPRSLGPAHAATRREGPQTAADRTVGSNFTRFLCDIKDLLAEREGFSSNSIFETLADWEHQLQHLENARQDLAGDEFGGPEL